MKLPRKLKKGYKNVWWTKHRIIGRINFIRRQIDEVEQQGGMATKDTYDEVVWLENKLKHPYPVTKWTRKAERMLFKKGEKK